LEPRTFPTRQALQSAAALALILLASRLFAQQPYYEPPPAYGQRQYTPPPDASPYQQPAQSYAQPLSAQDLQQLVAPIALYPDTLIAQILAASTYPIQVTEADRWRRAQGYSPSEEIAAGANAQPWDPSVKALTAFPQVLAQMDQNLHWTSDLGNAYYNQPQDVLDAVQMMRQRAQQAGNLRSTPQQSVTYDQGDILLAPPNPQVVYVPAYDPWSVYGAPVAPYPGFSLVGALASVFGSPGLRFGLGIAMNAFARTPWGWLGWGLNWLGQSILFNGGTYFSHSRTVADWGLPHGGPRAFGGREFARAGRSYPMPGRTPYFARTQGFARTSERDAHASRGEGRGEERHARGYPTLTYQGPRDDQATRESANRFHPYVARSSVATPSQYARSGYGSTFNNHTTESHGRQNYANLARNYGAPSSHFERNRSSKESSRGFSGKSFSKSSFKQPRSGGFHLFGGGGHAPKIHSSGKSFTHGHSGGGGHSGGKHHR
jgi:hypothetical protein